MDPARYQRIRINLSEILPRGDGNSCSQLNSETVDNDDPEDCLPSTLSTLSTFSALKDFGDKRSELLKLQNELSLKPYLKGYQNAQKIANEGVELSNQIASYLAFMHDSSQILQQALKDPLIRDALPLPHHLHSKAIQVIEDSVWLIKHRRWQPMGFEVDWGSLLPKLVQEIATLLVCANQLNQQQKQLADLKEKLDIVLKHPLVKIKL